MSRHVTSTERGIRPVFTDEFINELAEDVAALVLQRLPEPSHRRSPYMTTAEAADYLRAKPQRVHDLLSCRAAHSLQGWGRSLGPAR